MPSSMACSANGGPTSIESGIVSEPRCVSTAVSSSADGGIGCLHRVVDAGVRVAERLQDPAVVRPVVRQGDEVDLALLWAAATSASSRQRRRRRPCRRAPPTRPPGSLNRVESSLTQSTRWPRGGWRPRRERRVRGDGHGCYELSWTDGTPPPTPGWPVTSTPSTPRREQASERRLNSRWLVERLRAAGSVPLLSTGGVDGPPSSSGLGHHPFKVAARVRIPLGVHINTTGPVVKSGVHAGLSSRRSRVQVPSGPQRHRCAKAQRERADGRVAQSAERPPEKRKVPGSTPGSTTSVCPAVGCSARPSAGVSAPIAGNRRYPMECRC